MMIHIKLDEQAWHSLVLASQLGKNGLSQSEWLSHVLLQKLTPEILVDV